MTFLHYNVLTTQQVHCHNGITVSLPEVRLPHWLCKKGVGRQCLSPVTVTFEEEVLFTCWLECITSISIVMECCLAFKKRLMTNKSMCQPSNGRLKWRAIWSQNSHNSSSSRVTGKYCSHQSERYGSAGPAHRAPAPGSSHSTAAYEAEYEENT